MATNQRRLPKSFHFSSQYKSPFHRNEDRLSQVDFRTFDPFVPESRQTVANCKKHRRQRHELSDKCKHVLGIVDAQERLLSTRPEAQQLAGYSAQGATMRKPEISIEFGDDIPEIAKEYVKFWIEQSGMVKEPFSRQYDVHNLKDEHNHLEKPSVVLMTPFVDVDVTDENRSMALIRAFFEQPKEFSMKNKVGNLRIYSTNKKTHEEDAVGYLNHLPIKIVGKEMITKNLQKAVIREEKNPGEKQELKDFEDYLAGETELKDELKEELDELKAKAEKSKSDPDAEKVDPEEIRAAEHVWGKQAERVSEMGEKLRNKDWKPDKNKLAADKRKLKRKTENRENRKRDKSYREKQNKILRDMLSPEKNIAPNRLGEGTNPIGYAMQAAETPFRTAANVLTQFVSRRMAQKEKEEDDKYRKELDDLTTREEDIEESMTKPLDLTGAEERRKKWKSEEYLHGMGQTSPPGGPPSPPSSVKSPGEKMNEPIIMGGKIGPEQQIRTEDIDEPSDPRIAGGVGDETITSGYRLPSHRPKKKEKTRTRIKSDVEHIINPLESKNKSEKYLNTSDLIIIAKLKQRGI